MGNSACKTFAFQKNLIDHPSSSRCMRPESLFVQTVSNQLNSHSPRNSYTHILRVSKSYEALDGGCFVFYLRLQSLSPHYITQEVVGAQEKCVCVVGRGKGALINHL